MADLELLSWCPVNVHLVVSQPLNGALLKVISLVVLKGNPKPNLRPTVFIQTDRQVDRRTNETDSRKADRHRDRQQEGRQAGERIITDQERESKNEYEKQTGRVRQAAGTG